MSKKDERKLKKDVSPEEAPAAAEPETAAAEPETAPAAEPEAPAANDEALSALQARVGQLEKELADKQELLLRTAAEYDNFRKRTAKEKEAAWTNAKASTVEAFLPALDNLDRAIAAEGSGDDIRTGVKMIHQQFCDALKKLGVEEIPTVGETLDPNLHHAVMHVEDDEHGENEIVECFQKGFRTGDRVIRYSMVKVAN